MEGKRWMGKYRRGKKAERRTRGGAKQSRGAFGCCIVFIQSHHWVPVLHTKEQDTRQKFESRPNMMELNNVYREGLGWTLHTKCCFCDDEGSFISLLLERPQCWNIPAGGTIQGQQQYSTVCFLRPLYV